MELKSIAVLPFTNMSGDVQNEYFSDGITEEIINALTKVEGLKVTSRTSSFAFKNLHRDIREIAKALGVNTVLEGSIRQSGNRIRITAQLIKAEDGFHIFSKNFDRELSDIFAIQDEISLLIAEQIRENFGHFNIQDHLVLQPTQNTEAYTLYLKGRFHQLKWNPLDYEKAIDFYNKSISLDPNYALPYCGLAHCYSYLFAWGTLEKEATKTKVKQLLEMVKGLNSNLPEYHLSFSNFAILFDWDFELAYSELQKALEISPNHAEVLSTLAGQLIVSGHFKQALEAIDKALLVDPLSANHHFMKGNILYFSKQYNLANQWMDKALELDENLLLAIQVKMACCILTNETQKLELLAEKYPEQSFSQLFIKLQQLVAGQKVELDLDEDYAQEFQPWTLYFSIYSNHIDAAFDILENGVKSQIGQYFCFQHDPFLVPIQQENRFKTLSSQLKTLNLQPLLNYPSSIQEEKSLMSNEEAETFIQQLKSIMTEELIYLDASLSLKSLAQKIDLHANKLSWLLNEKVGKNFNEFVNHYRLESFKKKAKDPANKHMTLLGIAYESGFNSKSVFNDFFKKQTGLTPKQWLKES